MASKKDTVVNDKLGKNRAIKQTHECRINFLIHIMFVNTYYTMKSYKVISSKMHIKAEVQNLYKFSILELRYVFSYAYYLRFNYA
jgi:hypothetical protein